ncbi:uncharacterized protein [Enoplosus armatus]|uniref:uncharacterized protein n=1 Tax=Enoplosus armatus TaxID=215367 RepID=UPI00399252FF
MTSTGTCMLEPTALSCVGHVSSSERGEQCHEDDVEHQSETTHVASEVDWLQDSFEEMEVTIDEDKCTSVENRLSDLASDVDDVVETTKLRVPGAEDSCDEEVYVPIIPQRSKMSELLLECEEEELEPWQKPTPHVHLKDEDDVTPNSLRSCNDQTDCKPEPSLLQRNAGFIVAFPQLTSNTEFIGSLGTQRHGGNLFTIVPAAQQQLFQKVATATVKHEDSEVVHTSEVHQISNNPVSFSSVQSPAVYATSSNRLQSDQSNSTHLF